MKKAIAIALAALTAAGAAAIGPTAASAASGFFFGVNSGPSPYHYYQPNYPWGYPYYHRYPRSSAYLSFGGPNFRLSFGVPTHRHHYRYAYGNPHVTSCAARYRTYNPATNMYLARRGVWVACNSRSAY